MPITRFGRSTGLPSARRRSIQRRFSASPPSIAASLEPVVEQPVASSASGACQRRLSMLHAPRLELRCLRVLVLVDHVLVEALRHQLLRLRLHPGRHEGGDVQPRVPIEHQLVVDDLVRDVRRQLLVGRRVPRDRRPLEPEQRLHCELCWAFCGLVCGCVRLISAILSSASASASPTAQHAASPESNDLDGPAL